jgi:tetratricopeptide (TPR) repeat protein
MAEENKSTNNSENENDNEEVIVIEEDAQEEQQEEIQEPPKKDNKLFLILIALLIGLIIMLLVLLLVVVMKKKDEKNNIPNQEIEKITKKLTQKKVPQKDIKLLIKKANILYAKGKKLEALKLLNKLSVYSEALSNYNLGVIKLKEKKYKKAINYFNKAIANEDNRCISALNAAYASLKLNDKKRFKYYTRLAELYLPEESKSKSYPFYYALTEYYLGREFESLAGLNDSKTYLTETKELKTAVYNLYDDPYNVIDNTKDSFILGISYARIGEWRLAKQELQKVALGFPLKAGVALALVELKLKEYKNSANHLQTAKQQDKVVYPIKVVIKPDTFDIEAAQENFKQNFLNKDQIYNILFYYAPYKVFNINQTIDYLQKGSFGLGLDNIEEASTYLNKSSTISKLNIKMSEGIRLALNQHILKANKVFAKLAKKYPYHSILHYDLALTYVNLKNYPKAYYHFLRAYHLDANNYLAGIFAIITGNKAQYKTDMIKRNLESSIDFNDPKNKFYASLLSFINDNYSDALSFVQSDYKKTKLHTAFSIGVVKLLSNQDELIKQTTILKTIAPKDIIANLLYFYANHSTDDMKKFALDFQPVFLQSLNKWDLNSFYYGSLISGEMYMEFAKISGQLAKLKIKLEQKLLDTDDEIPVLQNLAFVDLYTKHFEESYTIFNDLIDNKGIDDYKTLFYGAVASIMANHHANAIALLALSKRKNKNAFESRYGLALLYHEAKNLRGATIQYMKIPDGFNSRFFDFELIP